ncbi:MAG: GNAT family N-acetyltransferase [Pseudomonadota bacterium]
MTFAHELPTPGAAEEHAVRIAGAVPVIETHRLRLRAPALADFPAFAEIAMGPRSAGIGGPMPREVAWAEFMQMTATWILRGHGWWTVEHRTDAAVLGFVGLGFEPGDHEPELGYMATESSEGKGFVFEACRAAMEHARSALGLTTLVSYVDRKNTRSARLAERLGAARDAEAEALLDPEDTAFVYRHDLAKGRMQ